MSRRRLSPPADPLSLWAKGTTGFFSTSMRRPKHHMIEVNGPEPVLLLEYIK
jgi:hypothetical protein